jgi:predicted nuclease of restriction endonuclease-like RecB superfamily
MLRGEHAIITFDGGRAFPDRLTRGKHAHYLTYAKQMLALYRSGAGTKRQELHKSVANILSREPDCDPRRVSAFCKLLDDASEFAADPRGAAAALRLRVFSFAAKYHPLVTTPDKIFERSEQEVKGLLAAGIGRPWQEIEPALYADVMSFQPLVSFAGYETEQAFLSRYNVAQLQACLYRAQEMTVTARSDFKTVLRYTKLARLLHDIRRTGESEYRIDLSGPASVLHETRRYGINFARFIPALLSCRGWTMQATLPTPWGTRARVTLGSDDGYTSHLPAPQEFDSGIEEAFAKKFGDEQEGWKLSREGAILHEGQTTFVPDFIFRRADGAEVFMEIVGFWTPEYLEGKRQTLRRFRTHTVLLAVAHRSVRKGAKILPEVIVYKSALKVEPVLEALRKVGESSG